MKLFFMADIHGNAETAQRVIDAFLDEEAAYLICAGDIVPYSTCGKPFRDKNEATVASVLNAVASRVIACRGNNDADQDQQAFHFPMLNGFVTLAADNRRFIITHGHLYTMAQFTAPPYLTAGDVSVQGHTHAPRLEEDRGIIHLNPGSVTLPRTSDGPSYAVYLDGLFQLRRLNGSVLAELDTRRKV